MRYIVNYILSFLLFFGIHYFEGVNLGGQISFAQLWKMPILLILLIYNILSIRKRYLFEKSSYALSVVYFFNLETLYNLLFNVIRASKQLPLALWYGFFEHRFRNKSKTLETILFSLAQFICLSSIPILSGIITPLKMMKSAESFGIEGAIYYSGIFGATHAAASYFCVAILVLVYGFINGRFRSQMSKIYNIVLIVIGLVSIFLSYTRTGWLMLIVGLFILLRPTQVTYRKLAVYIVSLTLIIGGIFYLYNSNELFFNRLTGKNIYAGSGGENIELSGSGRTTFWYNGVTNWTYNGMFQLLFGAGYTKVVEDNFKNSGMRVISHNQFIDTLSQNGLVALFLLITFYLGIYQFIKRTNKSAPYRILSLSIYWCSLVFAFFQNEMYFNYAIIFALVLALLNFNSKVETEIDSNI